MYLGDGKLTCK